MKRILQWVAVVMIIVFNYRVQLVILVNEDQQDQEEQEVLLVFLDKEELRALK